MAKSQNGYVANNRALIHNPSIPGTKIDFPGGLRKGAVTTVLLYVALQLHLRVENGRDGLGMWGFAMRLIRGSSTSVSNHGSGTAFDWRAHLHPLAKRRTFTPEQVATIRQILREVDNVVRWGGDYSGRADEMHFEINATLAAVERVAAKLLNPRTAPARPTPPGERLLEVTSPAMQGADVQRFQRVADAWYRNTTPRPEWFPLGDDGVFGPQCEKAARYIQDRGKIEVDGKVGKDTRALLGMK